MKFPDTLTTKELITFLRECGVTVHKEATEEELEMAARHIYRAVEKTMEAK